MAVKIILRRKIAKDKEASLLPLLIQMRALATSQPGYISGETLRNMEDPEEVLVISRSSIEYGGQEMQEEVQEDSEQTLKEQ